MPNSFLNRYFRWTDKKSLKKGHMVVRDEFVSVLTLFSNQTHESPTKHLLLNYITKSEVVSIEKKIGHTIATREKKLLA